MELLKPLKPIMAIAKTLEPIDPALAYFCELYAIEKTMKLKKEHPEANDMLMPIVNEMFEACGKHKALIPESVQVAEGERIVITAADTALQEAKAQDLAGKGDKQTMQSYLQAMVLYLSLIHI
eukprot:TRINITY_DN1318_c0_g1_i6.p2 TRINITY_DN1318_c0_g1~~TRINITY_DN1318_c0_g1_i6.p2  ORF type:complete len:123 (-),score=36.96 TRINITY_DN1318_c0_g1_i6:180-548(-)